MENIDALIDFIQIDFDKAREEEKNDEVMSLNLFVFISGHFNKTGNFITKVGETYVGEVFLKRLEELNADNILMIVMGCYSEAFVGGISVIPRRSIPTVKASIPCDVGQNSSRMGRLRRTLSNLFSNNTSCEPAKECVPGSIPPRAQKSSLDRKRNNIVAYCSSPTDGKSPFKNPYKGSRRKVDTSLFTTFFLKGLTGAKTCFSIFNDGVEGELMPQGAWLVLPFEKKCVSRKLLKFTA